MFGLVGRLALGRPALLPQALEREPAQHRGLAGAGGRAAGGLVGIRGVPQLAEDVHAAHLELGRLRVLVLVDHVLVEALGHQHLGLRLHPGGHERGQVEPRVAVEHQLVVHRAGRRRRERAPRGQMVAGDAVAFEGEDRSGSQFLGRDGRALGVFQRHGDLHVRDDERFGMLQRYISVPVPHGRQPAFTRVRFATG